MKPQMKLLRLLALMLTLTLGAAACGSSGGATDVIGAELDGDTLEIVASQDFVLASAERTASTSYNFDMAMRMTMDMGFISVEMPGNSPIATGSVDDGITAMRMDLGVMFEEMAESNPMFEDGLAEMGDPEDLVMNMIMDGDTMYLNAPFFGAAGMSGTGLDAIVDGWGSIDLTQATGLDAASLSQLTGQSGLDPTEVLRMLEEIGSDVTEAGREQIDGVDTTKMITQVSMGDLVDAQPQFSDMASDPSLGPMLEDMRDIQVDYIVYIDDNGLIRQLEFDMPMGELLSQAAASDPDFPAGMEIDMSFGATMRFFDYGNAEPIEIPSQAVDITNQLSQLAG